MVFPSGFMNVSAGLDEGCRGGVLRRLMDRRSANDCIAAELNGGPLSDSWFSGFPSKSYVDPNAGSTAFALVDFTIFAVGKRDAKS